MLYKATGAIVFLEHYIENRLNNSRSDFSISVAICNNILFQVLLLHDPVRGE
jgi:hypothetical protein